MIAGPNGAGKTTLARELIACSIEVYEFINADEIARGLAPMHPETVALAASKLMILRMHELLKAGKDFAFETTASGTNYIKHLKQAKADGYQIDLVYVWVASAHHAVERVGQRVRQGGHHVPEEVIIRRYQAGLKNLFAHYMPLADQTVIVDNSGQEQKTVAIRRKNGTMKVLEEMTWEKIKRGINE